MGGDDDAIYTFPLYAAAYVPRPGEEDLPQLSLPEWFRSLMHGPVAHYDLLLKDARKLRDWGIAADIARSRANSNRIRELYVAREDIDAGITVCREEEDLVAYRLGTARAAERLPDLQNLEDRVWLHLEGGGKIPRGSRPRRGGPRGARGRAPS